MKFKFLLPLCFYANRHLNVALNHDWEKRVGDVMDCPDNRLIEKHPMAGTINKGKQVMHNGIIVTLGGYYGEPIAQMLSTNKGVHEPQEEYAFAEVIKKMPSGATMIELGAYWSFYSVWFNKNVIEAKTFLLSRII